MKVEYNNLYTHFVFTTLNRMLLISEQFRERIEKYITGIVNNNGCKMYSILSNFTNKPFVKIQMKKMNNEVMRLMLWDNSFFLLRLFCLRLGRNEVMSPRFRNGLLRDKGATMMQMMQSGNRLRLNEGCCNSRMYKRENNIIN